ncbi:phosphate transport system regulatory protein PhoU, partial [Vibrio parahaemolyticus V-223/04]
FKCCIRFWMHSLVWMLKLQQRFTNSMISWMPNTKQ